VAGALDRGPPVLGPPQGRRIQTNGRFGCDGPRLDQALVGDVAVEDDHARVVERDRLVEPGLERGVPGLRRLAGVGVVGEVLGEEAHPLDHAHGLRHGEEDRLQRGLAAAGHGEQPRDVAHADAVRAQEQARRGERRAAGETQAAGALGGRRAEPALQPRASAGGGGRAVTRPAAAG
jgi:hypothetical protein